MDLSTGDEGLQYSRTGLVGNDRAGKVETAPTPSGAPEPQEPCRAGNAEVITALPAWQTIYPLVGPSASGPRRIGPSAGRFLRLEALAEVPDPAEVRTTQDAVSP